MSPLYRRVLGADFDRLPPQVQALHDLSDKSEWVGEVDVQRGVSLVARIACRVMGLPPDGRGLPLTVILAQDNSGREVWLRLFAGLPLRSILSVRGETIAERIGLLTLAYRLSVAEGALLQTIERASMFGIPLPTFLHPRIDSVEIERAGAYHFLVDAHMPLFGPLVRYEGSLTRLR